MDRPMSTPWGIADSATEIAPGIVFYSTPSHGGYRITPERRAAMPVELRERKTFAGGNWYEEDCDAAIVVLAFPELFKAEAREAARAVMAWQDERWRGVTLASEQAKRGGRA